MVHSVLVEEDEWESDTSDARAGEKGPADDTDSSGPERVERLPKDVVFGLLSNERRRLVLRYLVEDQNPTTLSDLAEHIASTQKDKPVTALSSSERKRVYVGLYQCHLPKLDDANVLDYDQGRGRVQLRPEADQLLCYLPETSIETEQNDSLLRGIIPPSLLALGTRLRG